MCSNYFSVCRCVQEPSPTKKHSTDDDLVWGGSASTHSLGGAAGPGHWPRPRRPLEGGPPTIRALRAQLENRALSWVVSCWVGLWLGWVVPREVGSSARRVRSRPPPLTPADGHHRCFWLRHRSKRAQCARRHQASSPVRRAASCADGFLWLSSRAFCDPAGGRICVV